MATKKVKVKAVQHDGFDSRNRIGRTFGPEFSEPFDVTEEQLEALLDDPYLLVRTEGGKVLESHPDGGEPPPAAPTHSKAK